MMDLAALSIDKWTQDDLVSMYGERVAEIDRLDVEVKTIASELARRNKDAIAAAYTTANKTHGKITLRPASFEGDQPVEIDVEIRQTVEWDQAALRAAASAMPAEQAERIIAAQLSVPERVYGALPPGDVRDSLTAARTTKLSPPSIKPRFAGKQE